MLKHTHSDNQIDSFNVNLYCFVSYTAAMRTH